MDPTPAKPRRALSSCSASSGGVVATGLVGFLLVAPRPRPPPAEIEARRRGPGPRWRREAPKAREPEEQPRSADEGRRAAESRRRPEPAAPPRRLPPRPPAREPPEPQPRGGERAPAQVIPFPSPGAPRRPRRPPPVERRAPADASGAPPLWRPAWRARAPGFIARLGEIFAGRKEIDPSLVDEIEKVLLTADIGVRTSQKLLEEIRSSLSRKELADPGRGLGVPAPAQPPRCCRCRRRPSTSARRKPFVLLVIGVNGGGKTTTIGKLAAQAGGRGQEGPARRGRHVPRRRRRAARGLGRTRGDDVVRGKEGADPSSVIFDGVKRAVDRGLRRRHRRHRRPPAHQDRPDGGAEEGPPRGRARRARARRTRPGW